MRVVYDHQIFGWQEYGGISRYFYELALEMNRLPETEAMIVSSAFINRYLLQAPKDFRIFGRLVPKLPKSGRIIRLVNALLAKPLLACLKPDIVHETYYSRARVAPTSSKVIVTVFDMIHELFEGDFNRFDQTSRDKLAAVKRADHVICISENTRNDLIRLFNIDPNKISVTHLGFSLNKENMQITPVLAGGRYILYVGSRFGYKNFEQLLRAFAILKVEIFDMHLVCFGGGVLTRAELSLAKELGIDPSDIVQMSGADNILANLYTHAQVFVYPSLYEGFGIPPLEAMSCGCPVACSQISSIPEVVGQAGVYFDPHSAQSMAQAIRSLWENQSLREVMIGAGYERIKQFSWRQCAIRTKAIYDRILRGVK